MRWRRSKVDGVMEAERLGEFGLNEVQSILLSTHRDGSLEDEGCETKMK